MHWYPKLHDEIVSVDAKHILFPRNLKVYVQKYFQKLSYARCLGELAMKVKILAVEIFSILISLEMHLY